MSPYTTQTSGSGSSSGRGDDSGIANTNMGSNIGTDVVSTGFNALNHLSNPPQTALASQQQYLTIVQDPYPPLSSSPEFMSDANTYEQLHCIIDCIDIDDNRS